MKFTSRAAEELVEIDDDCYVMVEGSNQVHEKYQAEMKRGARLAEGRTVFFGEGMTTCDSLLVSLCLYRLPPGDAALVRDPKTGRPDPKLLVPLEVVRGWRTSMVAELVKLAKRLCGIDDGTPKVDAAAVGDEEKN